jgi:hypothetical protein
MQVDSSCRKFRHDLFAIAAILFFHHVPHAVGDGFKGFCAPSARRAGATGMRFGLLLQTGHANLEELIEVG